MYADWASLGEPRLMGYLFAERTRGKEIFSFEYERSWLDSGFSQLLDPDLQYYSGPQYLRDEKPNFGLFLDSSPDRWGRLLMRRRAAMQARQTDQKQTPLFETDYLLGVYDAQRMGALRFKENLDGPFLDDNSKYATPPWTSLRELEHASLQLEKDDAADDPDYEKWLKMIVAPGSSLGGARPKAGVIDANNHLWIAKFPSRQDNRDNGAWEMVTHDLAVGAGINMATGKIQRFASQFHTYLTRRFDRNDNGLRLHFASAMTLLGQSDGANHQSNMSYLHLAEFIMQSGSQPNEDLEELWRRMTFNICVANTDDHLRNHGFMLSDRGWKLSPAYDLNPNELGAGLSLNINEFENDLNTDLAIEVAPYFRLTTQRSMQILSEIQASIQHWQRLATHYGIAKAEQIEMEGAFQSR